MSFYDRKEPLPASGFDALGHNPREDLATAYGLLWLVTGDSKTDQNIRLAFAARNWMKAHLSHEEKRDGIERAKQIGRQLGVAIEGWM